MFTFDIIIDFSAGGYDEEIGQDCDSLLSILYDSRQIINKTHQLIKVGDTIKVPVACPELDSLARENFSEYAKKWMDKIEDRIKKKVEYIQTGIEVQYEGYTVPVNSSFYILYFGKFSPLVCGDTFEAIPLYKIPYTYHDNECYNDIRTWNWNYESLYSLWFGGTVGEKYALNQMQEVNSSLSKEGRIICKRIEDLTGIPTYYFLFNYRAWGLRRDLARKCPVTGKEWLISGANFNDFIAFKSDEARLVSELSGNR